MALVADAGAHGLGLRGRWMPSLGDRLLVHLVAGPKVVRVTGEVRHVAATSGGVVAVGVEFAGPAPLALELLASATEAA